MTAPVTININDNVRIKPTAAGWRAIMQHIDAENTLWATYRPFIRIRAKVPDEDKDGYITGQFWCLMDYFRSCKWTAGTEAPFTDLEKLP